jgi:hypothetical protein
LGHRPKRTSANHGERESSVIAGVPSAAFDLDSAVDLAFCFCVVAPSPTETNDHKFDARITCGFADQLGNARDM